jgi:hypothetical protein
MPDRFDTYWVYVARASTGEVLYVGMTGSVTARLKAHHSQAPWWANDNRIELIPCVDRATAAVVERQTIADLRPRFNLDWNESPIRHRRKDGETIDQILRIIAQSPDPMTTAEIRQVTEYMNTAQVCHRLHKKGAIKAVGWTAQGCRTGWVASWVVASSPLPALPMPRKAKVAA